jgi:hypothetical protein
LGKSIRRDTKKVGMHCKQHIPPGADLFGGCRTSEIMMNPFITPLSMTAGSPSSKTRRYGDSGAFQETSESWDRPSVPTGPALGEGTGRRPSGGKPDWYQMITDIDTKTTRHAGARSKINTYPVEVQNICLLY